MHLLIWLYVFIKVKTTRAEAGILFEFNLIIFMLSQSSTSQKVTGLKLKIETINLS